MANRSFTSNAQEIRHYAKQLLDDGAEHSREEILSYIREHAPKGQRLTDGMLSGAIRDLLRNSDGLYFSPSRGKYRKAANQIVVPDASEDEYSRMKAQAIESLRSVCRELSNNCTVNLFTYTGKDIMPLINQMRDICKIIEEKIETLKNM